MRDHISGHDPVRSNRLLARVPTSELKRLLAASETVELKFGTNIYNLGTDIDHVYFPNIGVISLLAAFDEKSTLEVGMVGAEGMVGLPLFLGVNRSRVKAIVQAKGTAVRITAATFLEECERGGALSHTMRRFTHSRIAQITQSALCLRFHVIEARLARWLLMTSDRVESNELPMTQEFLSNMLGVRREAVNRAAVVLQKRALISYSRSNILIIDRLGLETAACKCYAMIRERRVGISSRVSIHKKRLSPRTKPLRTTKQEVQRGITCELRLPLKADRTNSLGLKSQFKRQTPASIRHRAKAGPFQVTVLTDFSRVFSLKLVNKGPKLINFEPKLTNKRPKVINFKPKLTNKEPKVTNFRPKLTNKRPKVTDFKPKLTNKGPKVTNFKPKLLKKGLDFSNKRPKTSHKSVNSFDKGTVL